MQQVLKEITKLCKFNESFCWGNETGSLVQPQVGTSTYLGAFKDGMRMYQVRARTKSVLILCIPVPKQT